MSPFLGSLWAELGGPEASSTLQLSGLGDVGTQSRRGGRGPEKEQVAGAPGEELFTCQAVFTRASATCVTRARGDRQGLPLTLRNHTGARPEPTQEAPLNGALGAATKAA